MRISLRLTISILLPLLMLFTACDRRPSGVPGSKKMGHLLVDIYKLEGTLQAHGGRYNYDEDRAIFYADLMDKYGMTAQEFDSALSWYTKHPKQFERIYLRVMDDLEQLETDVAAYKFHPDDTLRRTDVWYHSRRYFQHTDSLRDPVSFEIENTELLPGDRYELSFLHRIAPRDSSSNLHAVMYINYLDGSRDSIITYTHNDSVLRRYTLRLRAREMKPVSTLSGRLLAYDSVAGGTFAYVDSVRLYREYNPQTIKDIQEKLDAIKAVPIPKAEAEQEGEE